MAMAEAVGRQGGHPIDLIEHMAHRHHWAAERTGDDELTIVIAGTWTDYHVSVHWRDDLETLHIACAFDFKVPEYRRGEVYKLIAQINEQLWIGHFDLWASDGLIMFRHGLLLNEALVTVRQCEALMKAALEACERYYQAFQFVVWAGKEPREALISTMFETDGHA
ncbi:MAG: YbjN domain-containing protein [Pseudomonadota bacterium]